MSSSDVVRDVEKLVAKWRAEAAQLRVQASRAQKRGDGTDLELFQSAQDAEGCADELEAALTQPAASGEVVAPHWGNVPELDIDPEPEQPSEDTARLEAIRRAALPHLSPGVVELLSGLKRFDARIAGGCECCGTWVEYEEEKTGEVVMWRDILAIIDNKQESA